MAEATDPFSPVRHAGPRCAKPGRESGGACAITELPQAGYSHTCVCLTLLLELSMGTACFMSCRCITFVTQACT